MAPPPPPPPPPPILLLLLLLLAAVAADVSTALRFDYATLTLGSLKLLGDAHLKNGTIRLSRDLPVPNSGAGRALYATPVALRGGFSTHPEPALRPGMRAVVQMLGGEADPPFVPAARPSMSFSANHQLLLSLQDSVSDYNALGLNDLSDDSSSDSLSSSSLTSTLRKGGHDIAAFSSAAAGDAAR
uniref:Legume lectin domain-containing protein n=1 Tax=Oryza barthii TaxID=65489 RepID=A0A0D3G2R3_9ORYZ